MSSVEKKECSASTTTGISPAIESVHVQESVQSESSSAPKDANSQRKKKIIIKKSSNGTKTSECSPASAKSESGAINASQALESHEQPKATTIKKTSLEVNLKPAQNLVKEQQIDVNKQKIDSSMKTNVTCVATSEMNGKANGMNGHANLSNGDDSNESSLLTKLSGIEDNNSNCDSSIRKLPLADEVDDNYHHDSNNNNHPNATIPNHIQPHSNHHHDRVNERSFSPELVYCVNVAELCSAYVNSDSANNNDNKNNTSNCKKQSNNNNNNNKHQQVVITGVSLKTLKHQYVKHVNHVEHETPLAPANPKERINTGIDIKSLKNSYVLHTNGNANANVPSEVESKNAINKKLITTGVNISSLKWNFNGQHENDLKINDCSKFSTGISVHNLKTVFIERDEMDTNGADDGVKIEKTKMQRKFTQGSKEDTCLCKKCNGHVYQMERIKAEKSVFHKGCFRCKECNKLLNVDNYSSHEGQVYCKPHFKQIFRPKAIFDSEDQAPTNCDEVIPTNYHALTDDQGRQKKYEMIIRENTPQELPPDVVRSNTKVEEPLDNLHLDLRNIRSRFESGSETSQISPTSTSSGVENNRSVNRSESILVRMQKYQSAACGEKLDESSASDRSDEEGDHGTEHDGARKESRTREKISFEGMSSLKSQWEQGAISTNNKEEQDEDKKEELIQIREKMRVGRSESMRETYERACKESNAEKIRAESAIIDTPIVKTESIKEKFEKGNIELDSEREEAEKIERVRKEREEELSVFSESETASKEARNKFKEIDANASKGPISPPPIASNGRPSFKHATSFERQTSESGDAISETVKCDDPIIRDDIVIDAEQLQQRFSYFENYKEAPKEPKRFQITPPREVKGEEKDVEEDDASREKLRDPDVVKCSISARDDVPKTDTAKKMLDKFKALENRTDTQTQPLGPKPIKRITPPKEFTTHNDPDHRDDSPARDPNIVRSSYKVEEEIPVEPEMARSLKEKFEKWSVEIENKKNNYDDEDDYVPSIDTTKNLKAKFEALKEQNHQISDTERAKPKVNRFVHEIGADMCFVCEKRIYLTEKLEFSGMKLHKNCFKCSHCASSLRLDNYSNSGGKLFCIPHFKQKFMTKGNYDEGFGREQHKDKWMAKKSENNNLEENDAQIECNVKECSLSAVGNENEIENEEISEEDQVNYGNEDSED